MGAISSAKKQAALTAERVREILNYDPLTGIFTWLIKPSTHVFPGDTAGCKRSDGYRLVRAEGHLYRAHRLAWLYVHGVWPPGEIDHINRDPSDNRLKNLREANRPQNMHNTVIKSSNKTGFIGVSRNVARRNFQVHVRREGKHIFLGHFDSAEDASAVYQRAIAYRGEFLPESGG